MIRNLLFPTGLIIIVTFCLIPHRRVIIVIFKGHSINLVALDAAYKTSQRHGVFTYMTVSPVKRDKRCIAFLIAINMRQLAARYPGRVREGGSGIGNDVTSWCVVADGFTRYRWGRAAGVIIEERDGMVCVFTLWNVMVYVYQDLGHQLSSIIVAVLAYGGSRLWVKGLLLCINRPCLWKIVT